MPRTLKTVNLDQSQQAVNAKETVMQHSLIRDPLNKYMTALAYSQSRSLRCTDLQGRHIPAPVRLDSEIGCRSLRAGPVVPSRVVVVLAKGVAIPCARRLAAEHDRLPQSGHILVQRVLS